ncbi:XdhC family protein [Paenibacillus radicis (ex Gao et al. 2016)]|uniref:Xanthine dehydrogenase subunit A n=1 Tax=Paenibacillus radicis (ex Gao et al. 2016) TaxID=1737354 RepID=A0A917HIM5_9BACL|nr:XdhC family protein [Paenibacillus radicis (ex Gao et al. 2016)]GGG79722.1 putative xanthine dehydrogenase subunit A [Paenibacillus radicis (ex Gao et al. 2016)]
MDMHPIVEAVKQRRQPAALATIISVKGHSYRKAGASMLLLADGETVGTISPGCLEGDLKERTREVVQSGSWEIITYNLNADEDVIWGEAVGCGGVIEVLLEAMTPLLLSALLQMGGRVSEGETILLFRYRKGSELRYELLSEEEAIRGSGASADMRARVGDFQYLLTVKMTPRKRVILFGAGADSPPISHLLLQSGFRVLVADWRSSLLVPDRFAGAELVLGAPAQLILDLPLCSQDYVIVCSHQLQRDREMVALSVQHEVSYIGVMGSSRRIALLLEGKPLPSQVHAPIGLNIGAEGPDEIAVSIAAELIAFRAAECNGKAAFAITGGEKSASMRHLFGGGQEPQNGEAEAGHGAGVRRAAWQSGSAYSIR